MDAGASAVQVNSRSGGVSKTVGPTQDEWEAHRATISALYGEETLSRVRDIMKRDHGFEASERMYKTRVKHWRLDKKAKADEMLQALEMIEKRKAEGQAIMCRYSRTDYIRGRSPQVLQAAENIDFQGNSSQEDVNGQSSNNYHLFHSTFHSLSRAD